jgi:anaerobic ribonucleoside-triphosphate reductase activating protein
MSRDTWAPARNKITVQSLLHVIGPWLGEADGVTVSGGEPFDQPDALLELLKRLREAGSLPVIVYTGFPFDSLRDQHAQALSTLDVLISEPFDARQVARITLIGSTNQRVTCMTERGTALWRQAETEWRERGGKIDLIAEPDGSIWLVGVPGPGDLDGLGRRLGAAGIRAFTSAGRLGDMV